MWAAFKTTVTSAVDQHVPTKMTSTRRTHPWVNTTLRKLMRKKQRAHRLAKRTRQARDWNRYKKLQAEAQRSTRKAHKGYMEDIVSQVLNGNSKRFWSFIKSKRQEASGISAFMNEDGYLQSDSSVKAEILNKQFQSVYTREDIDLIPEKGPSPFQHMQDISINPNGVKKLLKDLKPYKAAGPDGIPTYILRSAAGNFSRIYQFSLDTGSVPSGRPVSLTSVACKVLENIVHSSIMRHLDQNSILTVKQHGFRKKRSTVTQLVATIQGIASSLRSGKDQVDVVLLDFSKAFDKVPHQRLFYKLSYYGVRGDTLDWIFIPWTQKTTSSARRMQVKPIGCNLGCATGNSIRPSSWPTLMTYLKLLCTQTPASLPMTVLYTDSPDKMQMLQDCKRIWKP